MAGLQRFITYINKYENDEKQDNAGFAKIEIRSSICRVEVHIRNISIEQTETTVYLFARKTEIMQGIPVGSMEIVKGSGDVRYAFDVKEMKNFGMSMNDMQGIFIPLDGDTFLASQWKEGKISGKNFKIQNKQEQAKTEDENNKPSQTAGGDVEGQQDLQQRGTAEFQETTQHPDEDKADASPQGGGTITNGAQHPDAAGPENSPKGQPEFQKEIQYPDTAAQTPLQNSPVLQSDVSAPQENGLDIPQMQSQEKRTIHATELPLENFKEETGWERVFGKLRLKSGVCFPFEGQELECVRMNLNDLREFRQKYWYLGKNSFLLHGFFNYRHILLGETEERGKKEYFLGIPGIFQNQERLMASMFGFPGFRTAKAAEYKTGNFGYWYRII